MSNNESSIYFSMSFKVSAFIKFGAFTQLCVYINVRLGYEGAIIKPPSRLTKTQQGMIQQPQGPVAFLTFSTRKDAELAKEKFQGFQLDPDAPHISLKLEFAKVNLCVGGCNLTFYCVGKYEITLSFT